MERSAARRGARRTRDGVSAGDRAWPRRGTTASCSGWRPSSPTKRARSTTSTCATNSHQRYQGLTFWSPNINIFRDPRWGRGQETYGEDPFLTGTLGVQFIRGLQGDDPKYFKTVATVKHFAVHSGPEPERHAFDAVVSERDLRETLPAALRDGHSRRRRVLADVRLQPHRRQGGVRQRHAAHGHPARRMEVPGLHRLRLRRDRRHLLRHKVAPTAAAAAALAREDRHGSRLRPRRIRISSTR